MGQYAKSIAGGIGLLAILSKDILGLEIPQQTVDKLVEGILAVGTWMAIYGFRNK